MAIEPNQNLPPTFDASELKMPDGSTPLSHNRSERTIGIVLVVLILALLLILGGLYLWYQAAFSPDVAVNEPEERFVPDMPNEPEMPNAMADIQKLNTVSSSNDLGAIEADLMSTDLETLDAEVTSIDSEFEAALQAQ